MAVYRFRVCMEENEDIHRDIDIRSTQNFEQFHIAIQEAFKFDAKHAASFFVSDDYWRKNQEITLKKEDLPLDEEEKRKGIAAKKLMAETKIAKHIEQPHQRFVYIFDPEVQWCFLIEMVKIAEENPKLNYPACIRTAGIAPKQYKTIPTIKEEDAGADPMAKLLASLEEDDVDDQAYKSIDKTEEHGVGDDDLESLEGEEGDEENSEELNEEDGENAEGDGSEEGGFDEDERY